MVFQGAILHFHVSSRECKCQVLHRQHRQLKHHQFDHGHQLQAVLLLAWLLAHCCFAGNHAHLAHLVIVTQISSSVSLPQEKWPKDSTSSKDKLSPTLVDSSCLSVTLLQNSVVPVVFLTHRPGLGRLPAAGSFGSCVGSRRSWRRFSGKLWRERRRPSLKPQALSHLSLGLLIQASRNLLQTNYSDHPLYSRELKSHQVTWGCRWM